MCGRIDKSCLRWVLVFSNFVSGQKSSLYTNLISVPLIDFIPKFTLLRSFIEE